MDWLRRLVRILRASRMLADLERRLATQDNRATAWPLYVVEEQERIYGMDPDSSFPLLDDDTGYIWQYAEDWEYSHETDADLRAEYPDEQWTRLSDPWVTAVETQDGHHYNKIFYVTRWKFVCAHFTEEAATRYIQQNRHNLKNPRVYVTSQHRCHEWQDVVRLLGSLER